MTRPAYKLAHIDIKEIALAVRKELMVADSHYFAWPAKQQERFRATPKSILTMCHPFRGQTPC